MDWNNLRDQVSNLSLYDVKAGIRKVQNAVMNYTEMEAKVREATNNEPWGASSSLMQEIANGTFNYQLLNEIMPMIYKRFTEKSAEEWRQIYKALQLMEFLVKNGSERVIDDARAHLSLLKMLRQFHFIDQNGKDQGINVRNRSKELTELLSDVDRIRTERKKSRANKNKYGGVEGGAGSNFGAGASSSRYGGFGSESGGYGADFGGATRGVYGDGGGFGGEGHDEYDEGGRRGGTERFDEYDEFDDGGAQAPPSRRKPEPAAKKPAAPKKVDPPKPKEPEVDLFSFGDDDVLQSSAPIAAPSSSILPPATNTAAGLDEDDFDDFQEATPAASVIPAPAVASPTLPKPNYSSFSMPAPPVTATTQFAQPTPQLGAQNAGFSSILNTTSPPPQGHASKPSLSGFSSPPIQQQRPAGYQPSGPNYFTSVQIQPTQQQSVGSTGSGLTSPSGGFGGQGAKKGGSDAFAGLLAGSGMKKNAAPAQKGLSIADMAKQKSQAGLYGANAPATMPAPASGAKPTYGGSAMNDLLG